MEVKVGEGISRGGRSNKGSRDRRKHVIRIRIKSRNDMKYNVA